MNKLIMNFAPMLLALMFVSPAYSKDAGSTLRIVRASLLENGNFYFVKGSIYNPNSMAVKNVVIKYYVWKKWMGQDGYGLRIKQTGGLVLANIKYLPPKQTVEFTATGGNNAPVMVLQSGLMPDPLNAEMPNGISRFRKRRGCFHKAEQVAEQF